MLDKLQILQTLLMQINKQYHVVATELANLKNKPDNDAKNEATIARLTSQLHNLQKEFDKTKSDLKISNERLADKNRQNILLNEENGILIKENDELKQKNQTAINRAELIQKWLKNIDENKA